MKGSLNPFAYPHTAYGGYTATKMLDPYSEQILQIEILYKFIYLTTSIQKNLKMMRIKQKKKKDENSSKRGENEKKNSIFFSLFDEKMEIKFDLKLLTSGQIDIEKLYKKYALYIAITQSMIIKSKGQ